MRRVFLCFLASSICGAASSNELLCAGKGWMKGQEYEQTAVFRLDPTTLKTSVQTYNGMASGTATAQPDLYLGMLSTSVGRQYWFNLHRYTGELYYGLTSPTGAPDGKAEFLGTCKRAERKF